MDALFDAPLSSLLSPEGGLASLFIASFAAATLLPLSSEAVLFGVLKLHPDLQWPALVIATAGNTAGGMTTYALGRWFARHKPPPDPDDPGLRRQLANLRRWGPAATAFAWLPLVGDGLSLAAGWLKLGLAPVLLWQLLGRFARYWVVAQGTTF